LPFDKPVTVNGDDGPDTFPGAPPSDDVHDAANPVIALPPSNGATNETDT
jgi:hypothetical protein